MARSLTVNHTESLTASPLLLSFVLIACSWLALSAIAGSFANAEEAQVPTPPATELGLP